MLSLIENQLYFPRVDITIYDKRNLAIGFPGEFNRTATKEILISIEIPLRQELLMGISSDEYITKLAAILYLRDLKNLGFV